MSSRAIGREVEKTLGLLRHMQKHTRAGSDYCPEALGVRKMPVGYALMRTLSGRYWYWLRHDGAEGIPSRQRWVVYHDAVADRGAMTSS